MDTSLGNYNYIYKIGDAWYANVICEYNGEPLVGSKANITEQISYDHFTNCGVNDAMVTATKIISKGSKHALFILYAYKSNSIGIYVCHDSNPFIYDDIMVLGDWHNWDDYGYVIGRTGNIWTLIKVTQFPKSSCIVIKTGLNSKDDALEVLGIENLDDFSNYEAFNWEKRC
jgi:hypothetical protein